jgi:threonine dehydratase
MFSLVELEDAHRRIHAVFAGTPHYAWPLLAARAGAEVWVKLRVSRDREHRFQMIVSRDFAGS